LRIQCEILMDLPSLASFSKVGWSSVGFYLPNWLII
jgi:hypothetical protein